MEVLRRLDAKGISDGETEGLKIELHLMNGDVASASAVYARAIQNGTDSHRFHKAALQLVLLQNDFGSAMRHLEGMAKDVVGLKLGNPALAPTLHVPQNQ
jgi:hypothetical protein